MYIYRFIKHLQNAAIPCFAQETNSTNSRNFHAQNIKSYSQLNNPQRTFSKDLNRGYTGRHSNANKLALKLTWTSFW